jgi:flagellar hook-associated protein 3 FlgL
VRITPEIMSQVLLSSINQTQTQLTQLEEEASTGQAFQLPSDNPEAVTQSISFTHSLDLVNQYQQGVTTAQGWLDAADSALANGEQVWDQVIQLANEGANSTLNQTDRTALQAQVTSAVRSLAGIANTQYAGVYLFAGTNNLTPPWNPTTATWSGNNGAVPVQVGSSTTVTVNVNGGAIFPTLFQTLSALETALGQGPAQVSAVIPQLETDLSLLVDARTQVGSTLALVNQHQTRLTTLAQDLQENLSRVDSANMADVTTLLAQEEQVYQAALTAGSQILPLSLASFLT